MHFYMKKFENKVHELLRRLLKPIIKLCVAKGVRLQDLYELVKHEFVLAAVDYLEQEGCTASISKISVMTGVQRPEIKRVLGTSDIKPAKDYVSRVIGLWSGSKMYSNSKGPLPLALDSSSPSFHSLVTSVSTDLNPRTVLFELERLNLVKIKDDLAVLRTNHYSTFGDEWKTLHLGANDVSDLLTILQENAAQRHEVPHLQARTEFDNVPDEAVEKIRAWLLEIGSLFHKRVHRYLSQKDKDINPKISSKRGRNRVVLGTFSRVESISENEGNDD